MAKKKKKFNKGLTIFLAVRRWEVLTIIIYLVGTGVLDGPNTNDLNQLNDITISPTNPNLLRSNKNTRRKSASKNKPRARKMSF